MSRLDPTRLLSAMREQAARGVDMSDDQIEDFLACFRELDEHLSKGGALPEPWHAPLRQRPEPLCSYCRHRVSLHGDTTHGCYQIGCDCFRNQREAERRNA